MKAHGIDIPEVNCIFFDLDEMPNISLEEKKELWKRRQVDLTEPFRDLVNLTEFCQRMDFPYTRVYSGLKGFHFYIWLIPSITKNPKIKLTCIQNYIIHHLNLNVVDPKIIGDFRRILKIPNTLHIGSKKYCVVLPDRLTEIRPIVKYANSKHCYDVIHNPRNTIDDLFDHFPKEVTKTVENEINLKRTFHQKIRNISTKIPVELTHEIISYHCLATKIQRIKPSFDVRYRVVGYLKYLGYSDYAIADYFKHLNWVDFDLGFSLEKIRDITPCKYSHTSHQKAKICMRKKCPYYQENIESPIKATINRGNTT